MKKSNFAAMILGTIGGVMSALGMCMCLLPQWNLFKSGVVLGCAGLVVLLIMVFVWRRMEHKEPIRVNKKTILGALIWRQWSFKWLLSDDPF